MFDIGFGELVVIGVVALLVIGPERLPETVRTASLWLRRIRGGFNEIKQEIQQELHNDEVMRELRKAGDQLQSDVAAIDHDLRSAAEPPAAPIAPGTAAGKQEDSPREKAAE